MYKRVSTNDHKRDRQKGKWNEEPVLHSKCRAAAESKEENIRDRNGNQRTKGLVEERDGSETRKVKQRSASIMGMEFCLRERGVGDESGKVLVSVQRSEEFVNGEIQLRVRREENVGDVMETDEFCNKNLSNQDVLRSLQIIFDDSLDKQGKQINTIHLNETPVSTTEQGF